MAEGGRLMMVTANRRLDKDYCRAAHRGRTRRLCDGRGQRHRKRHDGGDRQSDLRAVFHDQGPGQGHRSRAQHGLRLHQAIRRPYQRLQRAWHRHDLSPFSAAHDGGHTDRRGDRRRCRWRMAGARRFWWSKTTLPCAASSCASSASSGYRVLAAENAAAGLRLMERESIDLLLTDIVMPGGTNGGELARRARQRWPQIKVIFTSGFSDARLNGDAGPLAALHAAAQQTLSQGRAGERRARSLDRVA